MTITRHIVAFAAVAVAVTTRAEGKPFDVSLESAHRVEAQRSDFPGIREMLQARADPFPSVPSHIALTYPEPPKRPEVICEDCPGPPGPFEPIFLSLRAAAPVVQWPLAK